MLVVTRFLPHFKALAMNEVDAGGLHCNVDSQREFVTSLL